VEKFRIMSKENRKFIEDKVISYRRDFHKFPEIGWTEFRTASKIAGILEDLGFIVFAGKEVVCEKSRMGLPEEGELEFCYERAFHDGGNSKYLPLLKGGFTGVVGSKILGDGPVVALRFDMDALNINESSDSNHFPAMEKFASNYTGIMHACGHDCHSAIGLGLAEFIGKNPESFSNIGEIKLIFQPAEEGVRGAKSMVDAGILRAVDYVIGSHVTASEKGLLVCSANKYMATSKLDVYFHGLPAHAGASPEEGKNAVMALCSAVMNVNAISRHSQGDTRINVGKISGGSDRNIIPNQAFMAMEIRASSNEAYEYLKERTEKIIISSADMYGVKVEISLVGQAPKASGDKYLSDLVGESGNYIGKFHTVLNEEKISGGSEDFTFMLNEVQKNGGKGVYFQVGSDKISGHHTMTFDIDESILIDLVEIYLEVLARIR